MPIRTYRLCGDELALTDLNGPTLDAVSLQLAEGVYTTLRTYDRSRLVGLSAHLQRLIDSHALVRRERPLDPAAIRSALRAVIAREGLPAARLRITTPFDSNVIYISIEPFEAYPPECYTYGVACGTVRLARQTPRAKLTQFIAPSRARKIESDPRLHEILLVDAEGRILEGITSNFFAVLNGALRTAGQGVLEGVTRGIVLSLAIGLAPLHDTPIDLADLPHLSEAFITSSSREVMPVVRIDRVVIGDGRPGPITQDLMARYRGYLAQAAEPP